MTKTLRIELDYPDMSLMPNKRLGKHWAATKGAKDAKFSEAFYRTKMLSAGYNFQERDIEINITFVQSDKRRRDRDGLLSAIKPTLDGIAKAIGVDDFYFEPITIRRGYNKEQSATIIELSQ